MINKTGCLGLAMLLCLSAPAFAQSKPAPAKNSAAWTEYIEDEFWARVNKGHDAEDFQAYLEAYPAGRYVPLAKLELARLKRGATRPTAAAPSAQAAPTTLAKATAPARPSFQQDPAFPIQDDMFRRLADDGALAVPPAEQVLRVAVEGTRTTRTPMANGGVAVGTFPNRAAVTRVEGGPLCRVNSTTKFIFDGKVLSDKEGDGLYWAGLVPLSMTTRGIGVSAAGDHTTASQATIENLSSAVFPLVPGKRFSFDVRNRHDFNDAGRRTTLESTLEYSCQASDAVSASVLRAELTGRAIPLQCNAVMHMTGLPDAKQSPIYFYWVEQAGCFVQDPNK